MTDATDARECREHSEFIREIVHDSRVQETRYQSPIKSDEQQPKHQTNV